MKSGATMLTALMAEEFRWKGVSVNGLWPKKTIATAVINNLLGGEEVMRRARRPEIMADAAHFILTSKDEDQTGIFFVVNLKLSRMKNF